MIESSLYRKQFAVAAISIFGCVFLGTALLSFIVHLTAPAPEQRKIQTPAFFTSFVEEENHGDLVGSMQKLERYMKDDPLHFYLLDEKGKVLYPAFAAISPPSRLPKDVHETVSAPGAEPGSPMRMITRLKHEPPRYLVGEMKPPRDAGPQGFGGPPPPGPGPGPGPMPPPHGPGGPLGRPGIIGRAMGHLFFPASFLTLSLMVLAGIGLGLTLIFRSLRIVGQQADDVISELKRGNLKARFPVGRKDEIGAAMRRFNAMADEIEKLVEKLRLAENSRNNLLQELTHDLRTPVASLQTILEGIFRNVQMNEDVAEMAGLAENEVEYLGRLVEDLLLLAQLTEPRFKAVKGYVDFLSLLEQECDSLARKSDSRTEIVTVFHVDEALVQGDEHMFERLVRNGLENAFAFARERVEVEVRKGQGNTIEIQIRDDGEGFSPEGLASFGERREQRKIRQNKDGRLSLGLGSVIMKSVANLHGGSIHAFNRPEGGAVVTIVLPKSA